MKEGMWINRRKGIPCARRALGMKHQANDEKEAREGRQPISQSLYF